MSVNTFTELKKTTQLIFTSAVLTMSTGCASLHSVSVTSIPQNRNQKVSANVSKWIILGLNFNNDYVDELTESLRRKCDGKVTGILTKYESTLFLIASKNEITATGFCSSEKRAKNASSVTTGG
jgi:hypothetical protein